MVISVMEITIAVIMPVVRARSFTQRTITGGGAARKRHLTESASRQVGKSASERVEESRSREDRDAPPLPPVMLSLSKHLGLNNN
ncbi:MAG TPA: hypothetical protein VFU81_05165 [Thermomicrobiales bacterium]|nr:hypothetical protein [Thermomicrobiales bacterium]